MANTKSAKKRIRRDARVRLQNQRHRSRARTEVKQARQAIVSGDLNEAEEAVREAAKWLDHAASKGVIHPNNASRRKSRLMKQLARLKAEK
ncbi:MAG: 30S ribosomal protein S20 [Aggregatilineales bacterium]|nr:30S ribosomal protein S20 [Aggregatilineales bacterium]HPV08240.1 30S ribosomal protein S20 [Aggregatilineales bacterium]HQE20016.1 30S ribosomal protein S20 [Aggregatilineales bacterium]